MNQIKTDKSILESLITDILDNIHLHGYFRTTKIPKEKLLSVLPHLISQKIESVVLCSLDTSGATEKFYINTYKKQLKILTSTLGNVLREYNCVFLQGFPHYLSYAQYCTPGMRTDIDLYVPISQREHFIKAILEIGYGYLAFNDNSIFPMSPQQISDVEKKGWTRKHPPLSITKPTKLPTLPFTINNYYLPYIIHNNQAQIMVALEIHISYSEDLEIEENIIINNSEPWPTTELHRTTPEATCYFNLIRLYHGVFNKEKRIRIIIDTACLLASNSINMAKLRSIIESGATPNYISIVCTALYHYHKIFLPLKSVCPRASSRDAEEWLKLLTETLTEDPENEI